MSDLRKKIGDVARRVRLVLSKALLRGIDDTQAIQLLQVEALDGEVFDTVEHIQPYGLSACPPLGSEVVAGEIGGDRDNLIALAVGYSADRPNSGKSGEVTLWSVHGQRVCMFDDGSIEILGDGGSIKVVGGEVTIQGDSKVVFKGSAGTVTIEPAGVDISVPASAPDFETVSGVKLATHTHSFVGLAPGVSGVTGPPVPV